MEEWIEELRPNTKQINVNHALKYIFILHPHYHTGKAGLRRLIRLVEKTKYNGYTVEIVGYCNIKGALILEMIDRYLRSHDIIEASKLSVNLPSPQYTYTIKFKG